MAGLAGQSLRIDARAPGPSANRIAAEAMTPKATRAERNRGYPDERMKRGNGSRFTLVTPGATESTTQRSVRGIAVELKTSTA